MQKTRWAWGLLAFAAGLAVAAVFYLRAPSEPNAAPTPAPTPSDGSPPIFSEWLRYEPSQVQGHAPAANFFIDAMLGHQVFRVLPRGIPASAGRQLLLDDDKLLLSSGKRLWTREFQYVPGMVGEFCYVHSSYCLKRLFETSFTVDGVPALIYDNQFRIERFPSHTRVRYELENIRIDERKFITYDDRAIATYEIASIDKRDHRVGIEVAAPYPLVPAAADPPAFPRLASGQFQGLPLHLYLDAPGFERAKTQTVVLDRTLEVSADGKPGTAWAGFRFANSTDAPAPSEPADDLFDRHARDYNRWFADNVPYFDASDPAFKKMWYYRWWIVRFHLVEADTPDLKGAAFYEGKLGFDNPIGFAVPAQLKELTYLRDPRFGLSQVQNSYRNRAANGAVLDPPGSPYWNETYSHWIGMALAEFNRVHPIEPDTLRALLPNVAADVRAWLDAYDTDHDALPERDRPRVTGYDLDILSYWYFTNLKLDPHAEPPALERVDFASFVYGNAAGGAELARAVGDEALANEFDGHAKRIRDAALAHLWDDTDHFFYPQGATDDSRIPIRELHGLFPFATLLAPDEPRYTEALAKLVDPAEFWARYPPVITSLYHYRTWTWEMDGLTRNIAPHPISMGARTVLQAIKKYHQSHVTPEHFMDLMARYNDLVYPGVFPGDPLWRPNVHEYYSQWEPYSSTIRPKPSDISHDFHSMYCSLIVEGAVGLTPREDDVVELEPLARQWRYFMLDRLRYRGHDLTIVWDQPDGQVRYTGLPEGFSLAVDGKTAFTRPDLAHVKYNLATRQLEVVGGQ